MFVGGAVDFACMLARQKRIFARSWAGRIEDLACKFIILDNINESSKARCGCGPPIPLLHVNAGLGV